MKRKDPWIVPVDGEMTFPLPLLVGRSRDFVGITPTQEDTPKTKAKESEDKNKSIAELVEKTIWVDQNTPFFFYTNDYDRRYLNEIYNIDPDHTAGSQDMILQWARQCEKSTTAAIKAIVLGCVFKSLKGLCIQPRFDQVSVFSQQRFKVIAESSPEIRNNYMSTKNIWQVGMKAFNTGSIFNFRSCYLSADAARGISADFLNIDELQDIISDNIGIIEQCQSHAQPDMKFNLYTGTPKTKMNPLSRRFEQSTQFEWMVKCRWCSFWNFLDHRVIGDKFFVCTKCGKELYPKRRRNPKDDNDWGGEWIPMRPSYLDIRWGFRINQIMVPFRTFENVKKTMNDPAVSFPVFQNEVLALPSEEGELVLTESDVLAACEKRTFSDPTTVKLLSGNSPLFMGIDHGTGLRSTDKGTKQQDVSFTVVVIGAWCPDEKFRILYMEKFLGDKALLSTQPMYFDELARSWKIFWVASDWGFGHINNERLVDQYAWQVRQVNIRDPVLLEMQSVVQKPIVQWNESAGRSGRYMIDRTQCMSMLVDAIKKKAVLFPNREIMQHSPSDVMPFIDDFISIYIEYDDARGTMRYDHTLPDDAFQATMLCYLAAQQYYGKFAKTNVPQI